MKNKRDKKAPILKHSFCFNENDNSGEQLLLETEWFSEDRGDVFNNQKLTLSSYCNSSSFSLLSAGFTPSNLRKLADELEKSENIAKKYEREEYLK